VVPNFNDAAIIETVGMCSRPSARNCIQPLPDECLGRASVMSLFNALLQNLAQCCPRGHCIPGQSIHLEIRLVANYEALLSIEYAHSERQAGEGGTKNKILGA
jgi:hypothetical protein